MSGERDWTDWQHITRRCPRCGTEVRTLGSTCPNCGKSFEPRGIVDHLPVESDSPWFDRLLVVVALWVVAGIVWLAIEHTVAAIILAGAAFVVLVGLVALNNWLIQRAGGRARPRGGGD